MRAAAVAAWLAVGLGVAQPQPSATCVGVGIEPQRTWRIERRGAAWQIAHWRGADSTRAVRLALPPAAVVSLDARTVSVRARTSNGGIDVTLDGTPASARLDIYVSYELEVNVDSSLTPAIDDLNTEGPVGVRCGVETR